MPNEMLETPDGRRIAFARRDGRGPTVVFLGGYASDMTGTKAAYLDARAEREGRAFLRFDYTGHGASSGRFEDGAIGAWTRDAIDAISALTAGPLVLVGSSMGGWIALNVAKALPGRIVGLVGIAAAPDFTEDMMMRDLTADERAQLMETGIVRIPSQYGDPLIVTRRLIEDGPAHFVLRAPYPATFPVRLLQGMADPDVPWETATRLAAHIEGGDVRVILVKRGDHRLSEPADLALLALTLDALGA